MVMDNPRPSEMSQGSGRRRAVPVESPVRLAGRSAAELACRYALVFAAVTVVYVIVFVLVDVPLVLIALGAAWFAVGWVLLGRVGDRLVDEVDRGYTTVVLETGMLWFRPSGWIPWDFDGVWKYTRSGVQAPVAGVTDPPGLYPSPHRPGRFEVWTGAVWTKVYRSPSLT